MCIAAYVFFKKSQYSFSRKSVALQLYGCPNEGCLVFNWRTIGLVNLDLEVIHSAKLKLIGQEQQMVIVALQWKCPSFHWNIG